jgi:hydroxyacylglutathione hydrolase
MTLEPNNRDLQSRFLTTDEWEKRKVLIPFSIKDELLTNPYFRTSSQEIREKLSMEKESDVAVFQEIRERKNRF